MNGLEKVLTEENLKKWGAKVMLECLLPPIKEISNRIPFLEEEIRLLKIQHEKEVQVHMMRNEEQAKIIGQIIADLRV